MPQNVTMTDNRLTEISTEEEERDERDEEGEEGEEEESANGRSQSPSSYVLHLI